MREDIIPWKKPIAEGLDMYRWKLRVEGFNVGANSVIKLLEDAYKKHSKRTWNSSNFEMTKPYLPKWAREALKRM